MRVGSTVALQFVLSVTFIVTVVACEKRKKHSDSLLGPGQTIAIPEQTPKPESKPAVGGDQCLTDLCGTYESANLDNIVRPASHMARIEADYQNIIQPYIESEFAYDILDTKEDLRLLAFMVHTDLASAVLSDDLKLGLNLFYAVDLLKKLWGEGAIISSQKPDMGGYEVVTDKARAILAKEKVIDVEGAIKSVQILLSLAIIQVFDWSDTMKISTYKQLNYANASDSEFFKRMFAYINTWEGFLQKLNPYRSTRKSTIVLKYESKEPVGDDDSEPFFTALALAYLFERAHNEPRLNEALKQMKRDFPLEVKQLVQSLKEIEPKAKKALDSDLKARQREILNLCKGNYIKKMKSFPLESEIEKFQANTLPKVTQAAESVLIRNGLDQVAKKVRELNWKPHASYEASLRNLRSSLEANKLDNEGYAASSKTMWEKIEAGDGATLGVAMATVLQLEADKLLDPHRETEDDCKDVKPAGIIDGIYPDNKIVDVSWLTVLFPQTSPFTMGHEIGHFVYKFAKDSPAVQQIIMCIKGRHEGLGNDPVKFENEDYADLFGAAVEREFFQGAARGENLFCYLRSKPTEPAQQQYLTLTQPLDDGHSSSLFRLISIAADNGGAPSSCQKSRKDSGAKQDLKRCWVDGGL